MVEEAGGEGRKKEGRHTPASYFTTLNEYNYTSTVVMVAFCQLCFLKK